MPTCGSGCDYLSFFLLMPPSLVQYMRRTMPLTDLKEKYSEEGKEGIRKPTERRRSKKSEGEEEGDMKRDR